MDEAQQAVALAPDSAFTNAALGDALSALGRRDEARAHYETALHIAKTVQPDFQVGLAEDMEKKLAAR